MGWREGQGVGERLKPSRRLPAGEAADEDGGDDPAAAEDFAAQLGVTLAPRDVTVMEQQAKDNFHGLGYTGLSAREFNMEAGKPRAVGGIGVGVFDEEEEQIYEDEDNGRRLLDRCGEEERGGGGVDTN